MQPIINPLGKELLTVKTDFCGRELSLEINRIGFRADAAVLVRCGDTVVLGTAGVGSVNPHMDYFPLSVDYEERFYAAGKISGSRFIKREGRPSDEAILIGRLIDRPIRPLFPKGYRNETQVVTTVLSLDPEVKPDSIALVAASTALLLTGSPFAGPVAGVRIGLVEGQLKAYPTTTELKTSDLDIMVACVAGGVMMVEAGANEVAEQTIVDAMALALEAVQPVLKLQQELVEKAGIKPLEYQLALPNEEIGAAVKQWAADKLALRLQGSHTERTHAISQLRDELTAHFNDMLGLEEWERQQHHYQDALSSVMDKEVRRAIVEDGKRPDGRALTEVRPLSSQVGVLPRTHGSSLFTRGMTQALNITTLAPLSYAQMVETMESDGERRYMHHFNAPGYTLGEVKRMGGPGRREIGHGYLAERAILPMLPSTDDFPYAIRTVTEIMSQHGSTSMAATCSSCLSLMDAGVPLKRPVSGVAMGLIMREDGTPIILTDIQDAEDFAGDMDFKVTGSSEGVTALQMDMKVQGLPVDILADALSQGKDGRTVILKHMLSVLDGPRAELSPYAPRVESIKINPAKIRDVIGKGGEMIQSIVAATGADIDIEEDGTVRIFCADPDGMERAKQRILELTVEPEVGTIYRNRPVVKVMDFGVFVNIMPGVDGMVHVSEIADHRIEHPGDELSEGDKVDVKLMAIDERGRLNLSIKKVD